MMRVKVLGSLFGGTIVRTATTAINPWKGWMTASDNRRIQCTGFGEARMF